MATTVPTTPSPQLIVAEDSLRITTAPDDTVTLESRELRTYQRWLDMYIVDLYDNYKTPDEAWAVVGPQVERLEGKRRPKMDKEASPPLSGVDRTRQLMKSPRTIRTLVKIAEKAMKRAEAADKWNTKEIHRYANIPVEDWKAGIITTKDIRTRRQQEWWINVQQLSRDKVDACMQLIAAYIRSVIQEEQELLEIRKSADPSEKNHTRKPGAWKRLGETMSTVDVEFCTKPENKQNDHYLLYTTLGDLRLMKKRVMAVGNITKSLTPNVIDELDKYAVDEEEDPNIQAKKQSVLRISKRFCESLGFLKL